MNLRPDRINNLFAALLGVAVVILCPSANVSGATDFSGPSATLALAPTPTPTAYAGTFSPLHRTLYVFGNSADPTIPYVALEVAMRLTHDLAYEDPLNHTRRLWIKSEPTWGFADYINQCTKDQAKTAGALVLSTVESDAGTDNFLVIADGYQALYSDIGIYSCDEPIPNDSIVKTITDTTTNPSPKVVTRDFTTSVTIASAAKPAKCSVVKKSSGSTPVVLKCSAQQSITSEEDGLTADATKTETVSTGSVTHTESTVETRTFPVPVPTPGIRLLWSSQEFMVGQARGYTAPFVAFAGLGTYLTSKVGQSQTVTTSGSTTTTIDHIPGISDAAAIIATSLSNASAVSVPGTNAPHLLKSAAADFATTVHNQIRKHCESREDMDLVTFCKRTFDFSNDVTR